MKNSLFILFLLLLGCSTITKIEKYNGKTYVLDKTAWTRVPFYKNNNLWKKESENEEFKDFYYERIVKNGTTNFYISPYKIWGRIK